MYEAKREQGRIRVYDPARDPNSPARLQRLSELRRGLHGASSSCTTSRRSRSTTAPSPASRRSCAGSTRSTGCSPPGEFLPLAERTGLIDQLTRWVLDAALTQARAWQRRGRRRADRGEPGGARHAGREAARHGRRAARAPRRARRAAHLELSERAVIADPRRATEVLQRLRALGVQLSLDDFGTGTRRSPTSSAAARRAQDRPRFVSGMVGDANDALIVRSTIDLAHNLGLEVVAEGVEGEEVLDRLRDAALRRGAGLPPLAAAAAGGARGLARALGGRCRSAGLNQVRGERSHPRERRRRAGGA